ncbi:DNA polymerase III subunit gamma/tau [Bdellovibrionota bacterium FG-1]
MDSYVVLARKWRPAQFSDIVGQHHIIRTLMNAIRASRIHHAYLFTGSRGIGKTSIARIFAKVIRCEHSTTTAPDAQRENIEWLQSCDHCASCKEIAAGSSVDVIEIDGASNNGVEAVREIRENAKYLPSNGSRKIYIIDEVHMLTTAAFNALLKTLEEPPAHIIFVFATTEPHKIPPTILSRCQRFDFRRVTISQIQTRLAEVTRAENIQADAGALTLIARAAEGGMRDAMSLLDQVISFSGSHLSAQAVRDSIGLIEGQTLLGIVSGIFARKPLEALALIEQAYQRGHDLRVLTRSLIEFLHGAVLAKIGAPRSTGLELSEEEWKELQDASGLRSLEEIELIFQVLHHGLEWIARSPQPKVVLDILIVKCATAEALAYVNATHSQPPSTPLTPTTSTTPKVTSSVSSVLPTATSSRLPADETENEVCGQSRRCTKTWEGFIEHVRQTKPLLASMLEHSHSEGVNETDNTLPISISPKEAYYKEQLNSRTYTEQLVSLSKDYFGRPLKIQLAVREGGESLANKKERELKEREQTARTAAQNHPIIIEAKALFGGDLGPIEITEEDDHASS